MDKKHPLRGVITDATAQRLAQQNQARAAQLIAQLGVRYVCHPTHAPQRRRAAQPLAWPRLDA